MERAAILCRRRTIRPEDLPGEILESEVHPDGIPTIDEVVRAHARSAYRSLGGNASRTARILGIARGTLYKYLGDDGAPPTRSATCPDSEQGAGPEVSNP
jgi:transcriptional regulator of acetoin/glycerol metabolism